MKIDTNTVVALTYELKVTNEEKNPVPFSVEVRDHEDPFYFIYGNSGLPEKFETLLKGKSVGDHFDFVLAIEDAYGYPDEDLLLTLPKSQFSQERGFNPEMLEEGNFLPLIDENGFPMQAKILQDLGEELLLDFNHPLVGMNLHFDGEIHLVREATDEEIKNGYLDNGNT